MLQELKRRQDLYIAKRCRRRLSRRISGRFSSEFVHDELLLSTPGTVEQLQRVLSAPLTRVAKIEHSYHFDDTTWQKPSAEWFSSAYDPALFDIIEACSRKRNLDPNVIQNKL